MQKTAKRAEYNLKAAFQAWEKQMTMEKKNIFLFQYKKISRMQK